jgi:hypothetical protein
VVRHNTISNCEQAGIVGSLGAVFSRISDNHIYNIWTRRQFSGAEMAGIKLHAAIDVEIRHNRIHNTGRGLWLDWMAQGTRVSGNLLYDNSTDDLFVEVNHGPFLIDNNVFLSPVSLRDVSQGGAYAHNLMVGRIVSQPEPRRSTPYHQAHTTALAGLFSTTGGDNRFVNNIFVGDGFGLWVYNHREFPLVTSGNVYVNGARAYFKEECGPSLSTRIRPEIAERGDEAWLSLELGAEIEKMETRPVDSAALGKARISGLGYENGDGTPLVIDTDYFGQKHNSSHPLPGPFAIPVRGELRLW